MKDEFRLGVYMHHQGEWKRAGVLSVAAGGGTAFSYMSDYVGPPLSPDLDYRSGRRTFTMAPSPEVRPARRNDLFRVFQDCLPGEWGERVLAGDPRFGPAFQVSSPAQRLYMMGSRRVGAFYFQPEGVAEEKCLPVVGEDALARMERDVEDYIGLLSASVGSSRERWALTSNGGRQPKVAYRDADPGNPATEWVAKFSQEVDGSYELPRVEAAMLSTSRAAGLNTADSVLKELGGNGRAALLSKRFDREILTIGDRCVASYRHKLSMDVVMLGGDASIGTGQAQADYVDLAAWLQANSSDAGKDVKDLFGRMVLNAYTNNTDDHLGNMEVLQDDDFRWRLAPNYDLLIDDTVDSNGDSRRVHRTTMGGLETPPYDVDFLTRVADEMGIAAEDALAISERVLRHVEALPDRLAHAGCSRATLSRVVPALQLENVAALRMAVNDALEKERARREAEVVPTM